MAGSKSKNKEESPQPASIRNRKARYDFEIIDTFEAGIQLVGSEVKSIWRGRVSLNDAYCIVRGNELFLVGTDVEPYENASYFGHDRRRDRKLLMHRKEIDLIDRRSQEKGLTIVPLAVFFKHGKVKVEIGLARGKKDYDKRSQLAKDETRKEVERARSERE